MWRDAGKQEKDWKRAVRIQSVSGYSYLQALSGRWDHGGSMLIHYNTSSAGHSISRAKFIVEEGQNQNHLAFALVYHIDRLLGVSGVCVCVCVRVREREREREREVCVCARVHERERECVCVCVCVCA